MIKDVQTREEFDQVLGEHGHVIVDFWAKWCGPCRVMGEVLQQVEKRHGKSLVIVKINMDKVDINLLAKSHGFIRGITAIPTLAFFKNGKLVSKDMGDGKGIHVGLLSLDAMNDLLEKIGFTGAGKSRQPSGGAASA